MKVAVWRRTTRPALLGLGILLCEAGLALVGGTPARAPWGESYQQPGNGTDYEAPLRRRPRDAYYPADGSYARTPADAHPQPAPAQSPGP